MELQKLLEYLKNCELKHGVYSPVLYPEEMKLLIETVTKQTEKKKCKSK